MRKIAILVDLELNNHAGGHVKFWERICFAIKEKYKDFHLSVFFLGDRNTKKKVGKYIHFYTLKPILSSKLLRFIGVDADATDLFPINPRLFLLLKNFDLIHTTDQLFSMAKTGVYASKIWKIPLTTSLHTDAPAYTEYYLKKIFEHLPNFLESFFIKKIKIHKKFSYKQKQKSVDYLEHCSKAIIDDQLKLRKENFSTDLQNKITKLSRGVNTSIFKKKKVSKIKLMKKYGVLKNQIIIFFCGRVHELKGAILLSKVHRILKKKLDVVSIFAGENIHGNRCLKIGGDGIKMIGYVKEEEVSSLFNFCDLFVFPSKYEIGPQVVLEAKSCGVISVVSPGGGGRRIFHNEIDGVIIKEFDADLWASKILKLLKDKRKINFMKKKILTEFKPLSWNHVFEIYFNKVWKEILK